MTALHKAVQTKRFDIIELLINSRGIDINKEDEISKLRNKMKFTTNNSYDFKTYLYKGSL